MKIKQKQIRAELKSLFITSPEFKIIELGFNYNMGSAQLLNKEPRLHPPSSLIAKLESNKEQVKNLLQG